MDNDYNVHLNINAEIYDKFKKILKDNNIPIGGQASKLKKITSKLWDIKIMYHKLAYVYRGERCLKNRSKKN